MTVVCSCSRAAVLGHAGTDHTSRVFLERRVWEDLSRGLIGRKMRDLEDWEEDGWSQMRIWYNLEPSHRKPCIERVVK